MATGQVGMVHAQQSHFRLRGVPVFVYHGLTDLKEIKVPTRERKYWIRATRFKDLLHQVNQDGYRSILLQELWNATHVENEPQFRVALTFDDGLASDYLIAYPLLLEARMHANFFINTATVGKQGFLSWHQIHEMQRGGYAAQPHTSPQVP